MVNITGIAGDKGHSHPYTCTASTDGSNVLSVAYAPSELLLAAAWEKNTGSDWRPAW